MTEGLKLLRILQERFGYNDYRMAKRLGMPQTSYIWYRTKAKGLPFKYLIKAKELSLRLGMIDQEFWELVGEE